MVRCGLKTFILVILLALVLALLAASCRDTGTTLPDTVDYRIFIENDAGEPLAGAKIVSQGQPGGQMKITGLTDIGGHAMFPSIKTGEYLLEISRFDYVPVTVLTTVSSTNHDLSISMMPSMTTLPPTTGPPLSVNFSDLTGQPSAYTGRLVSVEGYYFSGFEISALASALAPSNFRPGNVTPVQPLIWVTGNLGDAVYAGLAVQTETPSGYVERYGRVFLSGLFEYGNGYGHLNAYPFRLTVTGAILLP